MSNVYSAVLMGLSWWKLLKALHPKIPKRLNPELRKQLQAIDPGWLEERYGKNPTRAVFPQLEKELDIREYINSVLHVGNYKTIRKSVTVLNKKL